jgi:vacuolar-type H+-ATPase subunit E/Vma4
MTLDKMRSSIIKDAEGKAAEMEREASEKASVIMADARSEASAILKKAEEEAKAEVKRVEMEKNSDLENMVTAMMNEAEADAVSKAMNRVVSKLSEVISKQNLDKMLKAAIGEMKKTTDEMVITVNRKGASSLKGYEVKHMEGEGFIIESKDGRVRLDATPSKIAEENAALVRAEIAAQMFGSRHRVGHASPSGSRTVKRSAPAHRGRNRPSKKRGSKR